MGAIMDHVRGEAASLVRIAFDPGDAKCPGQMRLSGLSYIGLCHTCGRFDGRATGMEPAARVARGTAECVNFEPLDSADASITRIGWAA